MISSIQGVYAAAVTPRRLGTQDINLGAMWDLFDFLVDHGAQGIVLLGSTGEFIHFSNAERMRLMGVAAKRSRVPIVFNCSHSTFDGAVELAQAADASGVAAVLAMPPYFFPYSDQYVADFFRQLVVAAELEAPLLLYNIPQFTSGIAPAVAHELLREGVAQGIKDSAGNAAYFAGLQSLKREVDFTLLLGNDALLTAAAPGGMDGMISGVASAVPELLVALHKAATSAGSAEGGTEVVTRLEARLRQFLEWTSKLPTPMAIKEATATRGLKLGPHSLANDGTLQRDLDAFREWFKGWLPAVLNECKHA